MGKAHRLALWNADGVRGKKIELEHIFVQHGVDISLLNGTYLIPGQCFPFTYYICYRTDRSTMGGGAAIFVRRGTDHHAVPVPGLGPLEGTIIETKLVGRPVKILLVYLSPSRLLIKSEMSACLSSALLVLMAGDLSAKHVD